MTSISRRFQYPSETGWIEDELFANYSWPDAAARQNAIQALRAAAFSTDQLAHFLNKAQDAHKDTTSALKHAQAQTTNELVDLILSNIGAMHHQTSVFNESSVHADWISILNGITSHDWLNALRHWEHTRPWPTSQDGRNVSIWHGDPAINRFMINIIHRPVVDGTPPEVVHLTAYSANSFESQQRPGSPAGDATAPWLY